MSVTSFISRSITRLAQARCGGVRLARSGTLSEPYAALSLGRTVRQPRSQTEGFSHVAPVQRAA